MIHKLVGVIVVTSGIMQALPCSAQHFAKLPVSMDKTYGRVPTNPIKLRKGDMGHSIAHAFAYLNGLRTSDSQTLRRVAHRTVEDPAYVRPAIQLRVRSTGMPASGKLGLLDKYVFVTSATQDTVVLYVDIYNRGQLAIPSGLIYEGEL